MSKGETFELPKAILVRLLCAALVWWALSEGIFREWAVAVITIVAAVFISLLLWPVNAWRWKAGGFVRFVPYFLRQSILGGFDVARRALSPSLPLNPGFIEFEFRLPDGAARVWFSWIVSLLPGTASTELRARFLRVHVLDEKNMPARETLLELEERVAALFGVRLG